MHRLAVALLALPLLVGAVRPTTDVSPPEIAAPPLFTSPGRDREVSALVSGRPDAVSLVIGEERSPMTQQPDETWRSAITHPLTSVDYKVVANYDGKELSSEVRRLYVLTRLQHVHAVDGISPGRQLLRKKLGADLGRSGGRNAATIVPASFDIDERRGRIAVLDPALSRVVTFDTTGRTVRTDVVARTTSDIAMMRDGSLVFLDEREQTVERGGRVIARGVSGRRLVRTSDGLYVRDDAQGALDPVGGALTARADAAAEVSPHSVVFGITGTVPYGIVVHFGAQVLDAPDVAVDAHRTIWALVGTYDERTDSATTSLVRVDPKGRAAARPVGSIFGDATRRLVPLRRGVAVMESDSHTVSFTAFGEDR